MIALRDGRVSPTEIIKGLPGEVVRSMLEDHVGRLWIGIDASLFIYEKGKFTSVTLPNGSPPGMVFSIAEDSHNDIWITHRGSPPALIRIRDGRVTELLAPPTVPSARELVADLTGGLWMGPREGGLARYQNGRLERYPFDAGPDGYGARQVAITPEGFVLGALGVGLMVVRDGRAQVLTVRNGLRCDSINGVVLDGRGYAWLYSECGLTSVAMSDLEKWWTQPDLVINARTLDALDGVRPGRAPFQIAARSTDGKLWFANGLNLQMLDPASEVANPIPPPVHIESVKADRTAYSTVENLQLPALSRDLEFDYTALSFVLPQRVRFRYRLEGYDADWTEAGTRRSAFYTNLGPGKYVFHVIACNNDGVWNEEGAVLAFDVRPAFFQTLSFRLLCMFVAGGSFWLFYLFRLRQATQHIQDQISARLEERERIARELHDTLLQGFQGLTLRLQGALKTLPREEPAHQLIEKILDRADEVLLDGRQSVRDLREEGGGGDELSAALAAYGTELCEGSLIEFSFTMFGKPQTLMPVAFNEACRIAREALFNAFRHSDALKIDSEVTYESARVCVRIRDNGKGFDEQILLLGRPGHWGLSGMRERAEKIGSKLSVWSSAGAGTEVELSIPSNVAYPHRQTKSWWSRIRRLAGRRRPESG